MPLAGNSEFNTDKIMKLNEIHQVFKANPFPHIFGIVGDKKE
jgi:hypothetical protein